MKTKKPLSFGGCNIPCVNCPYRKAAPLALWDRAEFIGLMAQDQTQFGTTYGCHKNDGTFCRGWFINQRARGFPSIMLRIAMAKADISRKEMDAFAAPPGEEMFDSIEEMAEANFPGITLPCPRSD